MFTQASAGADYERTFKRSRRSAAAWAGLTAVAVGVLLWLDPLGDVFGELGGLDLLWLIAAVGLEFASCVGYVMVFRRLFEPVCGRSAGKLAWLGLGAGAVLPGGDVAGLAASSFLLHRGGVPKRRLVVRSSALLLLVNAVSVAATAVAGALLLSGAAAGPHDLLRAGLPVVASAAIIGVVVAIAFAVRRSHGRAPGWLVSLADAVGQAGRSLRHPDWRLLGAAAYPLLDMAALWAVCAATGHPPSFASLIVAYNIGYLASIAPVPAGVGVLDGGLAAALILYGVSPSVALAAVLVYHALAVWVPAFCGLVASVQLRREQRPLISPAAVVAKASLPLGAIDSARNPMISSDPGRGSAHRGRAAGEDLLRRRRGALETASGF